MKKIVSFLCVAMLILSIISSNPKDCNAESWKEISSFTTSFQTSTNARKANIKLSSSKLDGVILQSGEILSFNKTVGKRTISNGYNMSTVIENGVYIGGVGGGVCQTSTTLYNAILRAGLKVSEVHPHTLSPEYVDASFDAMVSGEGSDFVFQNIYSYPIKISAKTADDKLTVKIFATNKIEGLEIIPYNSVIKTISPPKSITKLDTEFSGVEVEDGETVQYRNAKSGKVSKGYIMYKYNGRVIRIKQIRSDLYIPMQGINIIGTKKEQLHSCSEKVI